MAPFNVEDVLSGFQINWITLRDLDTGEIIWQGNEDYSDSSMVMKIKLPKKLFKSRGVSREVNFSSVERWEKFKIVQRVFYKKALLEELFFSFGTIFANSTNTWHSVIEAAPEAKMMTPEVLSGNIFVESKFYNGETLITTSKIQIFYV